MDDTKWYKIQVRVPASREEEVRLAAAKERRSVANYVLCALEERLAPGARGRRVRVLAGNPGVDADGIEGVTAGIDSAGALLVDRSDGGSVRVCLADTVVSMEG